MSQQRYSKFSKHIPLDKYLNSKDIYLSHDEKSKATIDSYLKDKEESNLGIVEYLKSRNITQENFMDSKITFITTNLVRESNLIEGIRADKSIYYNTREFFEIVDHCKAFEYVINNYSKDLNSLEIKNLHNTLMSNISKLDNKNSGEYRKTKSYIHSISRDSETLNFVDIHNFRGRMLYGQVNNAIANLEEDINKLNNKSKVTLKDIWNVHNDFEIIHPFYDGNERTGRLLLNWLSLKHFGEFINVISKKKHLYYNNIIKREQEYKKLHPEFKFYKDKTKKRVNLVYKQMFEEIFGFAEKITDLKNQRKNLLKKPS